MGEYVGKIKNGRGKTLSGGTIRHHLNAISNLYRRALSEGYATMNPIGGMLEKPTANREEARWLEVHDAALFLEAARLYSPDTAQRAFPQPYPLVATFLLTGGRMQEVLGLDVDDISFEQGHGHIQAERPPPIEDPHEPPKCSDVAATSRGAPGIRVRCWEGLGAPLPLPNRWRDAPGSTEDAQRHREACELHRGGDYVQDVQAHLLRGTLADARPRRSRIAMDGSP